MLIANKEISVSGRFFRVAKLRHEWFEFVDDPASLIDALRAGGSPADLFTFLQEAHVPRPNLPFHRETASASVLTIKSFDDWWDNLHFKARNKARKAQKCGVELRDVQLNDDFVREVKKIYDESPLRQGRRFTHYQKSLESIKTELSSFLDQSLFVGAWLNGELLGFMKLFQGDQILRTIHIIATLQHRDKCVMDALIARAVKICDEKKISYLHYGDWASRGLGVFRSKYNFQQHDCPRYFVPLTAMGRFMLSLRLHHPLRERLPRSVADRLANMRNQWNALRYGGKELSEA
ncbi:MAG TPA: hypothetical protein VFV81_09270 [Verrucomicrobiae bacterium]|nr:hypothetical protein [Verrucomicrobiae bacterium]